MKSWIEQAVLFGKGVILQFHQRHEEESEDHGETVANLKTVIYGIVSTAPDPLSKRQVQKTLHDYARDLYVHAWFHGDEVYNNAELEEALDTFDVLYEHEGWPE